MHCQKRINIYIWSIQISYWFRCFIRNHIKPSSYRHSESVLFRCHTFPINCYARRSCLHLQGRRQSCVWLGFLKHLFISGHALSWQPCTKSLRVTLGRKKQLKVILSCRLPYHSQSFIGLRFDRKLTLVYIRCCYFIYGLIFNMRRCYVSWFIVKPSDVFNRNRSTNKRSFVIVSCIILITQSLPSWNSICNNRSGCYPNGAGCLNKWSAVFTQVAGWESKLHSVYLIGRIVIQWPSWHCYVPSKHCWRKIC